MNELREGAQKAYCAYALWKSVPELARPSIRGVCMKAWPYAPRLGRRSSTTMNRTFREVEFVGMAREVECVGQAPAPRGVAARRSICKLYS